MKHQQITVLMGDCKSNASSREPDKNWLHSLMYGGLMSKQLWLPIEVGHIKELAEWGPVDPKHTYMGLT